MTGRVRGVHCEPMTSLMTWLVPAVGPVRDGLVGTVKRLATQFDAPAFQPHVTLIPNIDDSGAGARAVALASQAAATSPVDLTFASVGQEETYFRALYLIPEPSEQLVAVRESLLGLGSLEPWSFRPHLSLLYSDISEDRKRFLIDLIDVGLPLTVRFDAIELWSATPAVRDWYRVAKFPLTD